ncbi:MAG TPA: PAS domain S-box protein, partial [Deltaproteobacteria bacterium]|nr:PAS domain S-box protein [Deltaproteobacteria bacterium]
APLKRKRLLRTHVLGAMVRTGACALIWVLCLAALFKGAVGPGSFVGASASLLFVVLMNVPMLLVLRFTSSKGWFEFFSFCVNVLETFGYTAFIYFVGGFRSTYLTPIYAAMIFYVGVMAPMRYPLVLAGVSSGMFSVMVYLEHFGYLPHQNVFIRYAYTWDMIVFVLFILTAVLFLIACMAAYTSVVLNEAKKNLKKKNLALEKVNAMLSEEIHERIKAEALLRASEEKLKDIFDNVPDALFTHDLQGRFSDMNPCFREMIGLDQGAPLPGDLSIRDLVPGRFWPAVDAYLEDIVRKGRCEGVMSIVGMDGKKRILEFKNTLMKDGCGRPVGVRGCARDITERTRAEKERAKLQE